MEDCRGTPCGTARLFDRYRFSVARYSSYPVPGAFTPGFGPGDLRAALAARGRLSARRPLALAVQLDASGVDTDGYLHAIHREAAMLRSLTGDDKPRAIGMHGPSATLAADARFGLLLDSLEETFGCPDASRLVEIDAKHATASVLGALYGTGFVQVRLRCADAQDETALPAAFRNAASVLGVPADVSLSHGRTGQTPADLTGGVEHAVRAGARCIILTGEEARPGACLLASAIDTLCAAGYENAGLDVFVAGGRRNGSPFRSRYDVLGLGAGATTACADTYAQNDSGGGAYAAALHANMFAVVRGHRLSADDLLRRDIIHSLECLGTVSFSSVEYKHGVVFERYFAPQLAVLEEMQGAGLVELFEDAIEVTPAGRPVVRLVAAVFDRYLEPSIAIETENA
jgi:oxygen-independent coproporphyrinogen-3 oxidase